VQIDPALPAQVLGDALRLRQILSNLLHNALKFTPHGGLRLAVHALDGDRVRLEVHDTGPGLDEATQARLFQPFTQADQSTTRRFGGTGLGLAICRQLAALMGGSIGVHSTPGAGSCFHVELVLPPVQGAPGRREGAEDAAGCLAGTRVLLVEDNPVNLMVAQALLEHWGVQVHCAGDGQQALAEVAQALARAQPFDVVLMDLQMPGMSGYEATRQLRLQYPPAQLPVIALTAAALVSERERAMASGMNDFLTKPIDPERLLAALRRLLPPSAAAAA
jgi:CheY-like chemotaxis protein